MSQDVPHIPQLFCYFNDELTGKAVGITPGISGERHFNVDERPAVARVPCMPLLDAGLKYTSLHGD